MEKFPYQAKFKKGPQYSYRLMQILESLGDRPITVTGVKPGCANGFVQMIFPEDVQKEHRYAKMLVIRESLLVKE